MKLIKLATAGFCVLATNLLLCGTILPALAEQPTPTESSSCGSFPVSQPCPF